MDSIEFLHANHIFTIFFEDDLEFREVRWVLDRLLEQSAFDARVQEVQPVYTIDFNEISFTVWVSDMSVAIRRGGGARQTRK
jgi:hypothetical protein